MVTVRIVSYLSQLFESEPATVKIGALRRALRAIVSAFSNRYYSEQAWINSLRGFLKLCVKESNRFVGIQVLDLIEATVSEQILLNKFSDSSNALCLVDLCLYLLELLQQEVSVAYIWTEGTASPLLLSLMGWVGEYVDWIFDRALVGSAAEATVDNTNKELTRARHTVTRIVERSLLLQQ